MHAASRATYTVSSTKKAARRSPAERFGSHPRGTPRPLARRDEPRIVRFPQPAGAAESSRANADEIARRMRQVQQSWNESERERRRITALRKQDELLLLVTASELEETMRRAVADGEQPIVLPEIEMLQN